MHVLMHDFYHIYIDYTAPEVNTILKLHSFITYLHTFPNTEAIKFQ